MNIGRPDADPAPLYICAFPVSSCWLFEQCSKFNPHPYVHSVRPEFGDHDIARSNSPKFLYSDNIPMVTASPLTLYCSQKETGHLPSCGLSLSPSTMSEYILQEQHYIAPNLRDRRYCSIRLSYLYTVRTSSTISARRLPA